VMRCRNNDDYQLNIIDIFIIDRRIAVMYMSDI